MKKFCVIGDPTNKPRFSSNIITTSLNEAAKELGLYDESGYQIKYDGCCNTHGDKVDAFICTYEVCLPDIIKHNAGGRPIIGVSLHNWKNIVESNYSGKSNWFSLGVDTNYYEVTPKTKNLDKFVFGLYSESLVRGGFEIVIDTFGKYFCSREDVKLIVKDRNADPKFVDYVNAVKSHYQVDVEYINEHWSSKEQIVGFANSIDVFINTNKCSTFNMPVLEMMSMGKPCIITNYSGPADFCLDEFNCLTPKFTVDEVSIDLGYLRTIGCRNFFFGGGYSVNPVWANTDKSSLFSKMDRLISDKKTRDLIGKNARLTAEKMTWKKSINQLSYIVDEFSSQ